MIYVTEVVQDWFKIRLNLKKQENISKLIQN